VIVTFWYLQIKLPNDSFMNKMGSCQYAYRGFQSNNAARKNPVVACVIELASLFMSGC